MRVISSEPTSRGMKPNEAGVDVGAQWVPNRNSTGETSPKNASVSNRTERTMPIVVKTATAEQAMSTSLTKHLQTGCGRENPW